MTTTSDTERRSTDSRLRTAYHYTEATARTECEISLGWGL